MIAWLIIAAVFASVAWYWRQEAIRWIMSTRPWAWFLKHMVRKVRFSWAYTDMTGAIYHECRRMLRPGDLILTVDRDRWSSKHTPGEWAHGAVCVSNEGGVVKVAEMTGDGFQVVDLFTVCSHADEVAVWRCRDWDDPYIRFVVLPACFDLIGTPYDPQFRQGADEVYCFELWQVVDRDRRLHLVFSDVMGEPTVTGQSVTKADNAYLVFDSRVFRQLTKTEGT